MESLTRNRFYTEAVISSQGRGHPLKLHFMARPAVIAAAAWMVLIAGAGLTSQRVLAAPPPPAPTWEAALSKYWLSSVGVSGAYTNLNTDFTLGSADGGAGAVCLDATFDIWRYAGRRRDDPTLRYAGEFSGIRIAAAVSLCQGFGTASEHVGGFDGRTTVGTFGTLGAQIQYPITFGGSYIMPSYVGVIIPYAGAGGVEARVKVEAAPFEKNSSLRGGWYYELGLVVPVTNSPIWGTGTVQNIDAAATELYMGYRHFDVGNQTLNGGSRTSTDWDMIFAGARIRY